MRGYIYIFFCFYFCFFDRTDEFKSMARIGLLKEIRTEAWLFELLFRTYWKNVERTKCINLGKIKFTSYSIKIAVLKEYLILCIHVDIFELYISLRLGENFRGSIFSPREKRGRYCWKKVTIFFSKIDSIFQWGKKKGTTNSCGTRRESWKIVHFFPPSRFGKFVSAGESENFAGNNALSGGNNAPRFVSKLSLEGN